MTASGTDAPAATPALAVDGRVWRAFGDPLVPATGTGPLQGTRVAVKDLFALEGFATGAGSEEWLAEARPETTTAAAPAALLAAGAVVAGIARTDEFAYSLAGTNTHYGTPPNPKAPDRISGGSSSGSASAVSLGQADIGLGTDTGGSIRVPAAYQGLYGIRTTHGAVSVRGLLPLAPSFDTVGWMTRDAGTLAAVGNVLLPGGRPEAQPPDPIPPDATLQDATLQEARFAPELLALAEPDVRAAVDKFLHDWTAGTGNPPLERTGFRTAELPGWPSAFRTVQGYEAWDCYGWWISRHWDSLGADVAARFRTASQISPGECGAARELLSAAREDIRSVVGSGVLVLPSVSSVALPIDTAAVGGKSIEAVRRSTMQLTCIAGIAGLPAVNVPLSTGDGLPCGVSLIGAAGSDAALISLAGRLAVP
ncbi:glutamyl-tRNA amidotransferase [Arthrobacter sp. ISL-5]|nr:glutamyl-tRNA amidotransferase [Arthrobacter sp. ISL-5]